jgi:hypothetical protein
MAGERKGKTYEAIFKVALLQLKEKGLLEGEIFWNEKPATMTIEPDFTVGKDPDHPKLVFLITHSGSAKNSDMKFWRNMGELAEAKVRLPEMPRVYSVAFDSVIKEDLKKLQDAAFDGDLVVGDKDYGRRLQEWVDVHTTKLPKDAAAKVEAILDAMANRGRMDNPRSLIDELITDLKRILKSSRPELDHLWTMERNRAVGDATSARETFLRRGVGKLLLLDRPDQADPSGRLDKAVPSDLVAALKTMGLVKDSISGPRIADAQMLWALRSLSAADLAELHLVRNTSDRLREWIASLTSLAGVQDQLAYVATHWDELVTAAGMYRHLKMCHEDPHGMCSAAVPVGSRRVWLHHLVIEWIKLSEGTRTEFGIAAFIADLASLLNDPDHQREVKEILGRTPEWRSEETIRLGIQDWQSAYSGQRFTFLADDLARVADVLARRLSRANRPSPEQDATRVTGALVQTVLEAKLLTYRNFKPFEILLERALTRAGLKGALAVAVRACFAEAASHDGTRLDPRSSGTTVMRVKHTFINWQSAHKGHTNDKRKELCGRAVGLRYSWDATKKAFVRRPSVHKLFLIVDGTWRQEDLDALVKAGWDEIFYPDEMDKLVKAIV